MTMRQLERLAIFCAGVFVGYILQPARPPESPPPKQTCCKQHPEHQTTDARSSAYGKGVVTDITEMIERRKPAAIENARVEVAKYHLREIV